MNPAGLEPWERHEILAFSGSGFPDCVLSMQHVFTVSLVYEVMGLLNIPPLPFSTQYPSSKRILPFCRQPLRYLPVLSHTSVEAMT